ncbi:MAG: hypothetical protein QNJ71_03985 [Acidimicrobiia bacterium]|nr:hypothetical protein [Acidimicrobiia bacterium]
MAVLKGEGVTDIIYGESSIPAGPQSYGGYLARPDGRVEWPSILVLGPEDDPTGSVKDLCRGYARHAIAALAPSMNGEGDRRRRIVTSAGQFLANPAGHWSNGEYGYGVLAYQDGLEDALRLLPEDDLVVAVAIVGAAIDDDAAAVLSDAGVAVLYIGSREDEGSGVDVTLDHRDTLPHATFVVYPEGDTGFWSDDSDGYVEALWQDSFDRIVGFFGQHLPERV